jgi:hypothetical protein
VSRAVDPMDIAILADNSAAASRVSHARGLKAFVGRGRRRTSIALVALADRDHFVDYTSNRMAEGHQPPVRHGLQRHDAARRAIEVSTGLRRREATRAVIMPIIATGVGLPAATGATSLIRYCRRVSLNPIDWHPGLRSIPERGGRSSSTRVRARPAAST